MIIAGNWKLNPPRESAIQLYRNVREGAAASQKGSSVRVVLCPPAPYLGELEASDAVALGSQDISAQEGWGAFTGELSGDLLLEFGVTYAIVGHSERRQFFGERDSSCGRKVAAARQVGLTPILCVGETETERDAEETFEVVSRQLRAGLEEAAEKKLLGPGQVVIAYEPVWAIGTGRTATPEQAAEVHRWLRNELQTFWESKGTGSPSGQAWADSIAILYGGSVKPNNAAGLLSDPDIDGALVGGASLDAESFLAIVDAARPGAPLAS